MDKKNLRFLFVGVFLTVMLATSFIFADSYDLVTSDQTAVAEGTVSLLTFNVSNTTATGETATLDTVTVNLIGTASAGNITNVTLFDGTTVYYNDSGIFPAVITVSSSITQETNFTVNFTLSSSATWNKTFGANVTAITNSTTNASNTFVRYSTLPYSSGTVSVTEATVPTATATCTGDIFINEAFPCTCSGTDSGSTASGVSTSVGTSTSGSITDTSVTGVFTYTCTVTDLAGNSASATKQYTVFTTGGGGGSGGASEQLPQKKHTFAKITPGVVSIIKNFDPEIGIKEIRIEVNNEVQNVKITVTKHDGKPAEVSKEKSGKVYQYFEINTQNLGSNLNKATMRVKVEKTWVSSEGLEKNDVLVFKFDESVEVWKELGTKYVEEDNTYYYYDVELDSFSFFAISAKTLTEKAGEVVGDVGGEIAKEGRNKTLWIVLVVLAGLAVWFYFFRGKKK